MEEIRQELDLPRQEIAIYYIKRFCWELQTLLHRKRYFCACTLIQSFLYMVLRRISKLLRSFFREAKLKTKKASIRENNFNEPKEF